MLAWSPTRPTWRVQADLARCRSARALAGACARYVHLRPRECPGLADLHRLGSARRRAHLFAGDLELDARRDVRRAPGFAWPPSCRVVPRRRLRDRRRVASRASTACGPSGSRTLADTVGAGMRLLVCGLNPSVYSADVGVPFARPGNRFWPAALAAGLVVGRPRPVGRAARPRRGHDRPGQAGHAPRRRADHATSTAPASTASNGWSRGCGRRASASSGWPGGESAVDRKAPAGPQPGGLGGAPGLRHALDQRRQRAGVAGRAQPPPAGRRRPRPPADRHERRRHRPPARPRRRPTAWCRCRWWAASPTRGLPWSAGAAVVDGRRRGASSWWSRRRRSTARPARRRSAARSCRRTRAATVNVYAHAVGEVGQVERRGRAAHLEGLAGRRRR